MFVATRILQTSILVQQPMDLADYLSIKKSILLFLSFSSRLVSSKTFYQTECLLRSFKRWRLWRSPVVHTGCSRWLWKEPVVVWHTKKYGASLGTVYEIDPTRDQYTRFVVFITTMFSVYRPTYSLVENNVFIRPNKLPEGLTDNTHRDRTTQRGNTEYTAVYSCTDMANAYRPTGTFHLTLLQIYSKIPNFLWLR